MLAPALGLAGPAYGQTREHPLVVDGERVPLAELEGLATELWSDFSRVSGRRSTGDVVAFERWIGGEAAARGIALDRARAERLRAQWRAELGRTWRQARFDRCGNLPASKEGACRWYSEAQLCYAARK